MWASVCGWARVIRSVPRTRVISLEWASGVARLAQLRRGGVKRRLGEVGGEVGLLVGAAAKVEVRFLGEEDCRDGGRRGGVRGRGRKGVARVVWRFRDSQASKVALPGV